MLLDLNSMSIEEATGHLREVEDRKKKATGGAKEGRLLHMEEEQMACLKAHEGESSNSSHGGWGHGRGWCGGGGDHEGSSGRESQSNSHEEGAHHSKANNTC
jgi:hypothetical protein